MKVMGIDPGLDGAFVLLENGTPVFRAIMPVISIHKKKKGKPSIKREYCEAEIVKIIKHCNPKHVFIEKQHPMKGQGVTSSYSIGLGYGMLRGVVSGCGIAFSLIAARTWQLEMFQDMNKEDTKAASALICSRLWPAVDWKLKPEHKRAHDGATDAALIARYGWLHMGDNAVLFPTGEQHHETVAQ